MRTHGHSMYDKVNQEVDNMLKKAGLFGAGVLFGTAGIKILGSKDAKKLYANCTAAVLRGKDCVMDTVSVIQENAEDILAEAKQINEERYAQEAAETIEDIDVEDDALEAKPEN